jgi:hypothetical protein
MVLGVLLAFAQVGDGLFIHRPEPRIPLFLGGCLLAVGGMLKSVAVATDPEFRRRDAVDSEK